MEDLNIEYEHNLMQLKTLKDELERNIKIFELRKQFFAEYDVLLDSINQGPHYLKQKQIAEIVCNEIHRFDNNLYDLIAYCVMSNHVHLLINTSIQLSELYQEKQIIEVYANLDQIMKRIKGPTAIYANRYLGKKGQFWERESYDIYIRNEKMYWNVIAYILNNPVKARLVENWEDYKWSYLKGNKK